MTYHTEKIETAIAKIHECLDAPIDPVRVRRLLKDIGKWSAEAEREAYARGKADVIKAIQSRVNQIVADGIKGTPTQLEYFKAGCRRAISAVNDGLGAIRALIPEN